MRRRGVVVFAAGATVLLGAGCGQAAAARAVGSWGRAIEVPGLGALNKGGDAWIGSVSCPSAGNCVAGGDYRDRHDHYQGLVAAERNGRWGKAIEVPGLGALNQGRNAQVLSVSCASPGNCAAGGSYGARGEASGAGFVAAKRHGRWGKAIEVPGLAALNRSDYAQVTSVSCGSAGSCAAGGFYSDSDEDQHAFVAAERNGRWGQAIEVPGLVALNTAGQALVWSVSCGSAANCAAGGFYEDSAGFQGFVAVAENGVWGTATAVPGLGAMNKGGNAAVSSVSCDSAGSCTAGGSYTGRHDHYQGFVAVEDNGVWGQPTAVPGLPKINSISCPAPGTCAACGSYRDRHHHVQGLVAVEEHGVWGRATAVPGLAALNTGGNAIVYSVSCSSAGGCAAGGYYAGGGKLNQGYLAVERHGRWSTATKVPSLADLNNGATNVFSVSCPPAGTCAAGGYYTGRRHHEQGFVVRQAQPGAWRTRAPSRLESCGLNNCPRCVSARRTTAMRVLRNPQAS